MLFQNACSVPAVIPYEGYFQTVTPSKLRIMHSKFEKNGMLVGHKILFVEIFQNIPELMKLNQRTPKLNSVPYLITEYVFNGMIFFYTYFVINLLVNLIVYWMESNAS